MAGAISRQVARCAGAALLALACAGCVDHASLAEHLNVRNVRGCYSFQVGGLYGYGRGVIATGGETMETCRESR